MAYVINDVEYPSVSAILSVLDKPALKSWAARCAADYVREHLEEIQHPDGPHVIDGVLADAANAFHTVSKEATDIGTQVHRAIEAYIKRGEDLRGQLSPAVENGFLGFLEWEAKNHVLWERSEVQLYHENLCYAGTADAIATVNGHRYIIDFKTSKSVYDEYKYQLAAYLGAAQQMGEDVENCAVLRVDKETGAPDWTDLTHNWQQHFAAFTHLVWFYYAAKRRRVNNDMSRDAWK